jgi:hypothetical protein
MKRSDIDSICVGDKFKDDQGVLFKIRTFHGSRHVWCECCEHPDPERPYPLDHYDCYFLRDKTLLDRINDYHDEITMAVGASTAIPYEANLILKLIIPHSENPNPMRIEMLKKANKNLDILKGIFTPMPDESEGMKKIIRKGLLTIKMDGDPDPDNYIFQGETEIILNNDFQLEKTWNGDDTESIIPPDVALKACQQVDQEIFDFMKKNETEKAQEE